MQRVLSCVVALFLLCAAMPMTALAYNYMSAEEVRQGILQKKQLTLVDIQVEKEFRRHHIQGAVPTFAFPVETEEERARMAAAISALKVNNALAVVVCPRGGGGAKRAYDHLVASGIAENRVFILTKGQAAWPYPELLAQPE